MKVYPNQKFVLLHIPKTAGTSIGEWFDKLYGKGEIDKKHYHKTLQEAKDIIPDDYEVMFIIRNPFERVVSMYYWFKTSTDGNEYPHKKYAKDLDINTWVKDIFVQQEKSYADFILVDGEFPKKWDFNIIRFNNLKEDLKWFGDVDKLPHIYKTEHKRWEKELNEKSIELITKKDEWIINKYERFSRTNKR